MTAPEPRKPGRPVSAPCGTVSAYKRHRRRGEAPCAACRTAWNERQREMYRARKTRGSPRARPGGGAGERGGH